MTPLCVDEMFQTDELSRYLARMNLAPQWEEGVFDRLTAGEVPVRSWVLSRRRAAASGSSEKMNMDVTMRFIGYEDLVKSSENRMPATIPRYSKGILGTNDLERIYAICRDSPPPGYQGIPNGTVRCGGALRRFRQRVLLLRPGGLSSHPVQPESGASRMY